MEASLTSLPLEIAYMPNLEIINFDYTTIMSVPPEIIAQGTPTILAYLRDYEAMLMRQTIAGIAAGVGGIAGVMLIFRWRQRRDSTEKKKRA